MASPTSARTPLFTYADTRVCPSCRTPLPAIPDVFHRCTTCGVPLGDPLAGEVFSALQRVDSLVEDLREVAREDRRRAEDEIARAEAAQAAAAPAPTPTTAPLAPIGPALPTTTSTPTHPDPRPRRGFRRSRPRSRRAPPAGCGRRRCR